jgi:hypothetical protein
MKSPVAITPECEVVILLLFEMSNTKNPISPPRNDCLEPAGPINLVLI